MISSSQQRNIHHAAAALVGVHTIQQNRFGAHMNGRTMVLFKSAGQILALASLSYTEWRELQTRNMGLDCGVRTGQNGRSRT